jgi:hypothetical protein
MIKMICLLLPCLKNDKHGRSFIFNTEVQHDALEDKNDQDHQHLRINAQEANDLIKILRS